MRAVERRVRRIVGCIFGDLRSRWDVMGRTVLIERIVCVRGYGIIGNILSLYRMVVVGSVRLEPVDQTAAVDL